jgi:hypothetical protein
LWSWRRFGELLRLKSLRRAIPDNEAAASALRSRGGLYPIALRQWRLKRTAGRLDVWTGLSPSLEEIERAADGVH